MLPEVADTVTMEVPGVAGFVGVEDAVEAPLHPPRVNAKASKDKDAPHIPIYIYRYFLRLRHTGNRVANPKGRGY
jgi:hypothetical protein